MAFGLLGRTLGHSFSKTIHAALGLTDYTYYEKEPDEVADFFQDESIQGLNVTIPYKVEALRVCHQVSEIAKRIGCVNTMVRRNGRWFGSNTDYAGFQYMLRRVNIDVSGKRILILGDGATSKTVHTALSDNGAAQIVHLSRHQSPTYEEISDYYESTDLIINTTPVGMYPHCPDSLVEIDKFKNLSGVCDVVYNPLRTGLLLQAKKQGLIYTNGLPMLVAQAAYAEELFLHKTFTDTMIDQVLTKLEQQLENIVLIGMPGAGKTTIGKMVAEKLGRTFVDSDDCITDQVGSIADYIQIKGEGAFRKVEGEVIADLGKQTGLVIATGGGVVTVPANHDRLAQNGKIFYIQRALEELDSEGRVLSQGGLERLKALEAQRAPLYEALADYRIENQDLDKAVGAVLSHCL